MKFLIINMDGFRNKGCEALTKSIINETMKLDKDAEFKVFSHNCKYDEHWMSKNKTVSFLSDPFRVWLSFSSVRLYKLIGTLKISKSIENGMKSFRWADSVLSTGGDVFSSTYRLFFKCLAPIQAAIRFRKPVFLVGHSIGPFEKQKEYKKFVGVISKARLITVRESLSLAYLRNMNMKNTRIELTADPAFCLKPDKDNISNLWKIYNLPNDKIVVGIAPSQAISCFGNVSYDDHFKVLENTIRFLTKELGCHVLLIPHTQEISVMNDDRIICEMLYRKLGFSEDVSVMSLDHSAEEIRALVSRLDFLVAERMHAAIAGLAQYVPTFVVGYSVKAEGILGDLFGFDNLKDYMIPIEELNELKLEERIKNLFEQRNKISSLLSKNIPIMKRKAELNFEFIINSLGKRYDSV